MAVVGGGVIMATLALLLVVPPGGPAQVAPTGNAPEPSPSPRTNESMVLFQNPADGYELTLPAAWKVRESADTIEPLFSGVRRFDLDASGRFDGLTALTIMVGEPSGEFYNCFGGPCNKATARQP